MYELISEFRTVCTSYFLTVELHQRVTFDGGTPCTSYFLTAEGMYELLSDCGTPCTSYFLTVELYVRVVF